MKHQSKQKANIMILSLSLAGAISGCGSVSDNSHLRSLSAKMGLDDSASHSERENEHGNENEREHGRVGDHGADHHRGGRANQPHAEREHIRNPGNQTAAVGASISILLEKARVGDDDQYDFTAAGLPEGLSINGTTGTISGVITAQPGSYLVTISSKETHEADEGHHWRVVTFTWTITP